MSLADAVAGTLVVALNAYVLSGGADFGGGVWDLLASGPRKRAQRDLVAQAIGPVVQGLRKPAYDLSRGCSVSDIVNLAGINVVAGAV